jgi:hemerythrin-like domain-containing protein
MLTVLGKPPAQGDAVDLLLECHDRIRSFLLLARRIAEAPPGDAEVAEAAERVVRYFTQALPLHARDEEDSILPRLAGRDPALDAALQTMTREHAEHEAPLAILVAGCAELARDPSGHASIVPAIGASTSELDAHFRGHLRNEEEVVFPAIRRLLPPEERDAILREIRARRGVATPGAGAGRSQETA